MPYFAHPLARGFRRCSRVVVPTIGRSKISTTAAKSMLGFAEDHKPTIRELRHAYFEAAKRYHPDVLIRRPSRETDEDDCALDFREITEAYEHLLHGNHVRCNEEDTITMISMDEEEEYRQACKTMLGIPAEIVEESKQNPMFRHWLGGNTDGAQHWRAFFAVHGGLAQKLRPPAGYLGGGGEDREVRNSETRRKRGRR